MTFENLSNNLFEDQRKSKRLFKDLTNPRNKIHQKCMFSNCEAEAIQSHSISKNILKIINNEKVVYPLIDPCNLGNSVENLENTTEPNLKFEKKEITNVSKFRGFFYNYIEQHVNLHLKWIKFKKAKRKYFVVSIGQILNMKIKLIYQLMI